MPAAFHGDEKIKMKLKLQLNLANKNKIWLMIVKSLETNCQQLVGQEHTSQSPIIKPTRMLWRHLGHSQTPFSGSKQLLLDCQNFELLSTQQGRCIAERKREREEEWMTVMRLKLKLDWASDRSSIPDRVQGSNRLKQN